LEPKEDLVSATQHLRLETVGLSAGVLLCLALGNPAVAQQDYEYPVKIIRGRPDSSQVTLAPQLYATTINVRNPTGARTAMFAKRVAFTVEGGAT